MFYHRRKNIFKIAIGCFFYYLITKLLNNVCMKKKVMLFLSCFFLSLGYVFAQTTVASGTVVEKDGEPVIGASVSVKGTSIGTITDIDGKFTLNVPKDKEILVFSLIGMRTLEHKASPKMHIVMEEDSRILDEVVVTAMGITRERKALIYDTQGVSGKDLVQASNNSLSGALQGKVSGVSITPSSGMPGASSQIVIRGARSFSGNNTPLYVVDGMPVASGIDKSTYNSVTGTDIANRGVDIDPADIESIQILKGQAAAALYGVRASNGVIVITTKNAKNQKKGKAQISFNSSVSFEKLTRYMETQKKYAQGSNGIYNPYSSLSWGPLISELPNSQTLKDPNNPSLGVCGGNYDNHPGKYYVPQRAAAGLDPWVEPKAYNNVKDFFDTGVTWNNSLSVAQSTDKTNYSLFLSANNQDGVIPSTGMDRYTVKLGAETKLTSQWTSGFVGTYVNSKIDKAASANDGLLANVYCAPVSYNLRGIPGHVENDPYKQNHFRTSAFDNPYWAKDNNTFNERTSRFYGNVYTTFKTNFNTVDKKLTARYQLGTDAYTTDYVSSWGYGARKTQSQTGRIELESWNEVILNSLLNVNFDWNINNDWNLNAMLGQEFIQSRYDNKYESGANYGVPGWNNIKNATASVAPNKQTIEYNRTVGFFGNVSVSYKNMVYLNVTGREDIVSNMPRNNRSFFYPSVGGSFIFTELKPLKNNIIDFGKIRLAYAEVGQTDDYKLNYYYKPSYGGGFYNTAPIQYPIDQINGLSPNYLIFDPKLKPQNTKSYEVGADLTLLNGLIDMSLTYSRQNVKNQIFKAPLAASTGFEEMKLNGGKIHTNTYEASINVNPIRTSLVDWSFGFNFSKIDNYVDRLVDDVENIMLGGFTTPKVVANRGEKFPVIWGQKYLRDKNNNIIVDKDGMPMEDQEGVIGRVSPNFTLGFNTNIRIQKFRIAAVFDWKNGGQMYHGTNGLLDFYGLGKKTAQRDKTFIVKGVKEDGTKNDIEITPDKQETYYSTIINISESSIYDTDFIKLRELSVAYNVFKSSKLEIDVNGFARNILIWSKLDNFDPEASQGNNNMSGAFERFSLPQTSSYGFGLNLKF